MTPLHVNNQRLRQSSAPRAAALAALVVLALVLSPLGRADAHSTAADPAVRTLDLPAAGEIVWTKIAVRAKPARNARVIAVLNQFRKDFRRQFVLALAQRRDSNDRLWYRISVPGRPNGRTGWIAAEGVTLAPVRREIRIDRSARRLELWEGRKLMLRAKIAVGAPGMETPLGVFYVTWKFVPDAPILGAYALETSAYSKLSDWPGGGIVGLHGTPQPWLLGQAVSHGCVRMHNTAVLKLRRWAPIGTPIRIVA